MPGLQVYPSQAAAKMTPDDDSRISTTGDKIAENKKEDKLHAIRFEFKNNTSEVVFIRRCRLTEATAEFKAHRKAFMSIGEEAYELKFQPAGAKDYTKNEIILQTDEKCKTIIPLEEAWNGQIPRGQKRQWFPPFRKVPKFFCICYEVSSGKRSYSIRTAF